VIRSSALVLAIFVSAIVGIAAALDGVYAPDQAERGKTIFDAHCSTCHGEDLRGLEGPALSGPGFAVSWDQRSLADLFVKIRDTMPAGDAGALTQAEKIDVIAYVLERNGFSSGAAALTVDTALAERTPLWPTAPDAPLPTGTLARAAVCLTRQGNDWMLTAATRPVRGSVSSPASNDAADRSQVIRLLNVFPDPGENVGRVVQATGLIVKNGDAVALNVLSLEAVAPRCAP
jgi:mono/diheme cytochrome c family protein